MLKLREQGTDSRSSTPLPSISSSAENTRQNGSNDSDRYSDNEEGKILTDVNQISVTFSDTVIMKIKHYQNTCDFCSYH